jgi:Tol biopolymer transport system component
MMPIDRFERQLPSLLEDLAEPRTPDYFDELLSQTAHNSQRPAWTSPERWIPMLDTIRRPVVAPMPWRPIAVLVLIVIALIASLALAGARQPLPPVFGPAGNGLVVHSNGGDIFTYDPRTGNVRAIVTGPDRDFDPVFSQDGTRIMFQRQITADTRDVYQATAATEDVYIVRPDGGGLRRLTSEPLQDVWSYNLSPDGRSVAIVGAVKGIHGLFVANSDGSAIKPLDVGIVVSNATFRPTGSDILFVGAAGVDSAYSGLYLIDKDGTNLRTLLAPQVDAQFDGDPAWSPDGTRIGYSRWLPSVAQHDLRVHVMNADATNDAIVGHQDGAWLEAWPKWSPDGTRLLIERNTGTSGDWTHPRQPVVVSADGGAPDVLIRFESADGVGHEWSPDGTSILAAPNEGPHPMNQVLWDPASGESKSAPWTATSYPAWQRVAR